MENIIKLQNSIENVTEDIIEDVIEETIDVMPTRAEIEEIIREKKLNNITRFEIFGNRIIVYNKMLDTFIATLYNGKFFMQHENEPIQKKGKKIKNKIHTHEQRKFSNVYQVLDSVNSHNTHLLSEVSVKEGVESPLTV